jgi:uncharacterized protein (TIRG00374 family)
MSYHVQLPVRGLASIVAYASLGYLGIVLWSDWHDVIHAAMQTGTGGVMAVLSMSLVNYVLRFTRWQMYLNKLGHRPPWLASLRIYLAGYALTITPGKAGEALRSVFLKRFGVGYGTSLAALFSDRLSDLIAIVLIALAGLSFYPMASAIVLPGVIAVGLALVVLLQDRLIRKLYEWASTSRHRLTRWMRHPLDLIIQARRCHDVMTLSIATLLSLVAWSAEAVAFYWVLGWLGADQSLGYSFFVYAVSMLVGALSFLPGGLGGAEAAMITLLVWKGSALPQAVAATVLIRFATLWFAVLLGVAALFSERRVSSSAV